MAVVFPPENYQVTSANALLANALDLSAPASDLLLKNRKNAWVQLAGHPGFFAPASTVTIWKRQSQKNSSESSFYQAFQHDNLRSFMPKFYREIKFNSEYFIEIEDLLQNFENPCMMDIKMGTRTFLESEVEKKQPREDLYAKMFAIDPHAPTPEEMLLKAVTKLRYMQFREGLSSSTNLGFRVEAIKMANQPPKTDWKKTKTDRQVAKVLAAYVAHDRTLCESFVSQLTSLRKQLESSKFFKTHEIIGSSILMMYDASGKTGVWMIDFSKVLPLPPRLRKITHRSTWQPDNHEDGYLFGLDSLIKILDDLFSDSGMPSSPNDKDRSIKLKAS